MSLSIEDKPQQHRQPHPRIAVDVVMDDHAEDKALEQLREALLEDPPRIPSRHFYDDRGSELFERITELPEYYQTRTEHSLLEQVAPRIIELTGAKRLVELGSGAATKTRVLLDAMKAAGRLETFVPMDVSEGIVRRVASELVEEYPGLEVHAVIGSFLEDLSSLPQGQCELVAFLGGTIGNLKPEPHAREFLTTLAGAMGAGEYLLLGADLIKDRKLLHAAYNDAQGVTAEFNLNILHVVNRRFGGDFDTSQWQHRAFFNEPDHRIEMHLVALSDQRFTVDAVSVTREVAAGGTVLTEVSTKYDRDKLESLLERSGFELIEFFTDPDELFSLSVARVV